MITARGLPNRTIKIEMTKIDNGYTFLQHGFSYESDLCCKKQKLSISCGICGIKAEVVYPNDLKNSHDVVRGVVAELYPHHNHENIISHCLDVNDTMISANHQQQVKATGYNDIKCGLCKKIFLKRRYLMRNIAQKMAFSVSDTIYELTEHYNSVCTEIRADVYNSDRMQTTELFIQIMKKHIDSAERVQVSDKVNPFYNLIMSDDKCACGNEKIIKCIICESKYRYTKSPSDHYSYIIRSHFGKNRAFRNVTDLLVFSNDKKPTTASAGYALSRSGESPSCVICGINYDDYSEQVVVKHFKSCVEKNRSRIRDMEINCVNGK